jgi:hypothetical protein
MCAELVHLRQVLRHDDHFVSDDYYALGIRAEED